MNTPTTAPARLRVTHAACDGPLIRFEFGDAHGRASVAGVTAIDGDRTPGVAASGRDAQGNPLCIPCIRLAGPALGECWWAGEVSESAEDTPA